jgi:uncharacterized protein YbjT (DUF2867 family)
MSKVFIIGGTGAQGIPIIRDLVADGKYSVRVLTRDHLSPRAKSLKALGDNVELVAGSFTNEQSLRDGYRGCDAAFVNIDGFNTGEKGEMYWAIRAYELAVEDGGIRFFVYGNLDFGYKLSGYDPEFRTGHYDGKGRIGEWVLFQGAQAQKSSSSAMGVALFTTGPYIEMTIASNTVMTPAIEKNEKGEDTATWRIPLTHEGTVAHVYLDDCGHYVRWLFDHPEKANGLDLAVAIDHIKYADLAVAFAKVTGHPARFIDVDFDTYWKEAPISVRADDPAGYSANVNDPATMSVKANFTGFWNIWRHSRRDDGFLRRDYALLDEIHPGRVRSAEEYFKVEDERGRKAGLGSLWNRVQPHALKPILKLQEDGFKPPVLTSEL